YRMMNLPAAIGLAQLEKIDEQLEARKRIAAAYRKKMQDIDGLTWQNEQAWARHVYWMFNVVLEPGVWAKRDDVMEMLNRHGIETRPVFYPMHSLPPYIDSARDGNFPVADRLAQNGISLPTWTGLKSEDIEYICNALRECRIKV
ncbi:MAG TPA: DegT/DnrJ/EryC1/StrS family aminotransferase, partial [Pyrinomonadaceae bacterium]